MCKKQHDLQLSMKLTRFRSLLPGSSFFLHNPTKWRKRRPPSKSFGNGSELLITTSRHQRSVRNKTIINYHGTIIMVQSYRHFGDHIEIVRSNWVQCGEDVRPFFPLGQSKLSVIKNVFVCYTPLVSRSRYKQFRAVSKWFWRGSSFSTFGGVM